MKMLFFFLALVNFSCYAQLDIKESGTNESSIGKVVLMTTNFIECTKFSDTDLYLFSFRNQDYSTITDYKSFFIKGTESFNQLYDVLNKTLANKETKELEIDLGNNEKLILKFKGKSVSFWYWNNSSWSYSMAFYLKHIDKLFGKA
jgi:hypothetical protein